MTKKLIPIFLDLLRNPFVLKLIVLQNNAAENAINTDLTLKSPIDKMFSSLYLVNLFEIYQSILFHFSALHFKNFFNYPQVNKIILFFVYQIDFPKYNILHQLVGNSINLQKLQLLLLKFKMRLDLQFCCIRTKYQTKNCMVFLLIAMKLPLYWLFILLKLIYFQIQKTFQYLDQLIINIIIQSFKLVCNILKMTDTESENNESDTESTQFQLNKKEIKSKQKQKQTKDKEISGSKPEKGKGNKRNVKPKKQKKENQQKKNCKSKGKSGKVQTKTDSSENKQKVNEYMQSQNRPYNLLNIFDNLHGKIKKSELQEILNELTEQKQLTCKQFGKNKVYYPNQSKFQVNMAQVQQLGSKLAQIKQEQKELREVNKKLNEDYKRLMSKKVYDQLQMDNFQLKSNVQKLKKKINSLKSEGSIKIDQKIVVQIQNQSKYLDKQLSKRRKITKQCLATWSQILQKKIPQVAEIMGIQLI